MKSVTRSRSLPTTKHEALWLKSRLFPTLPPDFTATSHTADVHVHPSGKFVYGSNRGHDSIVIYAVNDADGTLSLVGHTNLRSARCHATS